MKLLSIRRNKKTYESCSHRFSYINELYVRFIPEKASIKFFSACVPAYLLAKCILSFHSLIGIIPIYVLTFVLSFVN